MKAPVALTGRAAPAAPAAPRARAASWRFARAIVLLLLIVAAYWLIARRATEQVRDYTPAELRARMGEAAQAGGAEGAAARALPVAQAIEQLNRMDVEARREVMRSDEAREYVNRLGLDDRARLVRETLDRGIQDQLQRYHAMNAAERAAFIARARQRQQEARDRMDQMSEEEKKRIRDFANSGNIQEVLDHASKAFLSLTTSTERSELQPLFEGALENLKYARDLK